MKIIARPSAPLLVTERAVYTEGAALIVSVHAIAGLATFRFDMKFLGWAGLLNPGVENVMSDDHE